MIRNRVDVQIPGRRYPILIGRGLLEDTSLYPRNAQAGRAIIVSNTTVAPLYLSQVQGALGASVPVHILPDGEQYKSMAQLNALLDTMLDRRLARDSTVIALGGGVVGDLAGFAAAIYQRGIELVQVPTTLLSQVDSSVGGKTAINHPLGKNMIGAFHQPEVVITDLSTLDTLPDRELIAGMAEVIKYGLLGDRNFLAWLESNMGGLLNRDQQLLSEAIASSCLHKARIVAADEREKGRRALLNLGHTFGHAIEAHQQYTGWLHGEAVGAGMCMAAELSARLGWINQQDCQRVRTLIRSAGLPDRPPEGLSAVRMQELMQGDKKVAEGRVRLVLLRALGEAVLSADYDDAMLQQTLQQACRT